MGMVNRRTISVRSGVDLSVIVREARPDMRAFVLVHGLASNARLWDGVGDRLVELGHASIAVDQRGHGESSKPEHGYDFATVTDDLAEVIEQALGRPAVVVGQSWGGNVVVEIARRHPDLVSGIVCVDGGFIQLSDRFPMWEDARAALAPPDFTGFTMEQMETMSKTRFADWPQSGVVGQLANFEVVDGRVRARLSRENHMRILRHLWEHRPDDAAREVAVPALVLAVGRSEPGREERVDSFVDALPDGRLTWMDAHHDVHAQHPELVADLIAGFAGGI
jgi:pimeloyl-ACP methyl ester carboxylesterase